MVIAFDLSAELSNRLTEESRRRGVDPQVLLRNALERALPPENVSDAQASEIELLERINVGFSEAFWQRFQSLKSRHEAELLSQGERDEWVAMCDEVELADARRLAAVAELARLRGTTLDAMLIQLGLMPGKGNA